MKRGGSLGLILSMGMASMILAAAVAGPEIAITTDREEYTGGNTIEVSLSGKNDGESAFADVYIGLLTPNGETYTLRSDDWYWGRYPWMSGIEIPSGFGMGETPFVWLDLPSEWPQIYMEGKYAFVAGLVYPDTMDFICELSFAPFDAIVVPYDCYVDAAHGDDSNYGSKESPWRTITHALNRVNGCRLAPMTVHIAEGVYSRSTNGETFPIEITSVTFPNSFQVI